MLTFTVAIDLTVFIEALPKSKDYILAAIPLWWSLGGVVGCLISKIWPNMTILSGST